jgi:CelD/BcsL family acetyltransferase involved in cellulose biosynthesis
MTAEIIYEELGDISEIRRLSPEWDELLELTPCNRAYSCSGWFLTELELFPSHRPMVLIARRGPKLAGLMPLVIDEVEQAARFAGSWCGYRDIIAPRHDMEIIVGLLRLATSGSGRYTKLILRQVRTDSNCYIAAGILQERKCGEGLFVPRTSETCVYVNLERGYHEYLRTRSRRFRNNLRTIQNKAKRDGLLVKELTPADIAPKEVPNAFISLHLSRIGKDTVLATPSATAFFDKLLPLLFVERRLRLFSIFKDDQMVAVHLSMVGKDCLCGWNGGFLREVQPWAPGWLLFNHAIKETWQSGFKEFDFWVDDEQPYKTKWGTDRRVIGQIEFDMM